MSSGTSGSARYREAKVRAIRDGRLEEFMEERRTISAASKKRRREAGKVYRADPLSVAVHKQRLLSGARRRAKEIGVEFSLGVRDLRWPDCCPVFGTELLYGGLREGRDQRNMPSLDRISAAGGYTPENTVVISLRANIVKSFGTAEEHERVARWLRTLETFGIGISTAIVQKILD